MAKKNDDIRVRRRKLDEYKDDPNNANEGTQRGNELIDDSLDAVGPGRSLVADGNDYLPAGNKTKAAAKRAGINDVIEVETDGDAIIVHKRRDWDLLSDEDKRARIYAYYDNRTAQVNLSWDAGQITADLESGIDLGAMFDPGELALVVGNDVVYTDVEPDDGSTSSDEQESGSKAAEMLEAVQAKWNVEVGQVWQIPSARRHGPHRVMCGDSRDASHIETLFAGKQAQIAFTSPPYAQQRDGKTGNDYGGIPEDDYVDWWDAIQKHTWDVLVDGGSFFVNIKPHSSAGERVLYVFDLVLAMKRQWGWQFIDEHIWQRHTVPGAFKRRLKNGFEPVYEFAKPGDGFVFEPSRMGTQSDAVMKKGQKAKEMTGTGTYYNISHETEQGIALPENIFQAFGVRQGIAHSAQYPVAVPFRFMQIYSNPGDIIFDPFLGSGTNIHAAEKARRVSYGIELMPEHVALMLEEWSLDGHEPELME